LGGGRLTGKQANPPPKSASEIWLRHYIWSGDGDFGCPICFVADTAEESRFCPKGQRLRAAALAEFKAIPPPPKKRPADTSFNPSIESQGR
jgi:hypothetical protein